LLLEIAFLFFSSAHRVLVFSPFGRVVPFVLWVLVFNYFVVEFQIPFFLLGSWSLEVGWGFIVSVLIYWFLSVFLLFVYFLWSGFIDVMQKYNGRNCGDFDKLCSRICFVRRGWSLQIFLFLCFRRLVGWELNISFFAVIRSSLVYVNWLFITVGCIVST